MADQMAAAERELWAAVQRDYVAALAIARKAWPQGPPDVVQAATATLLIEHGKRHGKNGTAAGQGTPDAAAPPCPTCGGPTQKVTKTNPKMPDYRCADRQCDTAVWLDRKKGR